MKISRFMADQYANPRGLFGRFITSNLLNRANRKLNQAVFDELVIPQGGLVLEIGFGGAELMFRIARETKCAHVHGVERSEAMLARAKNRLNSDSILNERITVHHGDISNLASLGVSFDCVCSINTIYFWPDLAVSAIQLASVTQSGSRVVLGYGTGDRLTQKGYADHGFRFYSSEHINLTMTNAGFSLETETRLEREQKDPFIISTYRRND